MDFSVITENKCLLLRWRANLSDEEFVYDRDFNDDIRLIYTKLGNIDVNKREINENLKIFFDKYHLGLLRALLTNIHFLHNTCQIKQLFTDLFENVKDYVKSDNQLFGLLINELQFFSDNKHDVAEDFIVFLLEKLQISENQIEIIFKDDNYHDDFKFFLFKANCCSQIHLRVSLEYFISYSSSQPYSNYQIDSLIDEYSKRTGHKGLELAILKYKAKGFSDNNGITYHGTKLIASFKDKLANWLFEYKNIPVKILLEPIILAIPNMALENKNRSIEIIFKGWGNLKNEILKSLQIPMVFQIITNDKFSSLLNFNAKNVLQNQVHLNSIEKNSKKVIEKLQILLPQKNKIEIESIISNANGQTLFYCLMIPDPKFCFDIFQYILDYSKKYKPWDKQHLEWSDKLKIYRSYLYSPENFQKLPQRIKHASVASWPFTHFMYRSRFEKIERYCNPIISKKVWEIINQKEKK